MSNYYDYDKKYDKNYWTGLILLLFITMIMLAIFNET